MPEVLMPPQSPIRHVVILFKENHAFDNYFGQLAEYRVNHQPPIQGAQLSDRVHLSKPAIAGLTLAGVVGGLVVGAATSPKTATTTAH